jgi:phosphoribosylformylglycinamidine synthase
VPGDGGVREGTTILLVGSSAGHLGQSLWLREIHGREDGPPPPVDLEAERRTGEFVRACIADGTFLSVHDVGDGGIAVAAAEMALAGGMGASLGGNGPRDDYRAADWFAEDQSLYLVATLARTIDVSERGRAAGVPVRHMGNVTSRQVLRFGSGDEAAEIPLADLRRAHESFFPGLMGGEPAVA